MTDEWEKVKEILKKPATPDAMKKAGKALQEYVEKSKTKAELHGSKVVCILGTPYPKAIKVKNLPQAVSENKDLYELMQRVVAKEGK